MIHKEWVKLFSLLKKLFGGSSSTSDLMERARDSAMMDQMANASFSDSYSDESLQDMMDGQYALLDHEEQIRQIDDQNFQQRVMEEMHDPYLNPGQDIVVDESYHGIDHGMDDSFHHHDH